MQQHTHTHTHVLLAHTHTHTQVLQSRGSRTYRFILTRYRFILPVAVMEANQSAHALLACSSESVVNAYGSADTLFAPRRISVDQHIFFSLPFLKIPFFSFFKKKEKKKREG